ncbi:putative Low temperature viability protein Ltv1 [Helianthus anomalus]
MRAGGFEPERVHLEAAKNLIYVVVKICSCNDSEQKAIDPKVAALLDDSTNRVLVDVKDLEEDFVVNANLPDNKFDLAKESVVNSNCSEDNIVHNVRATRQNKALTETVNKAITTPTHVITLKRKENLHVDFLPHGLTSATAAVKDLSKLKNLQLPTKKHGQESTKEEKKERMAAVKEEKREARHAKKRISRSYTRVRCNFIFNHNIH